MKLNFKLYAMGLMLAGALFATACQNNADGEGTEDEARESVVNDENGQDQSQDDGQASVQTRQISGDRVQNDNQNDNQNDKKVDPNTPKTTMKFDSDVYDFGTIEKGEKVNHSYTFTNTGSEPLIISNAKAACGCTVPDWPREPIAPGETGEIPVIFSGRSAGSQTKSVTITANTNPPQTKLTIKGQVVEASDS